MKFTALILATAFSAAGGMALATSHTMETMAGDGMEPFMAPMDTMMSKMPMMSTGKPDADFLLMMIPHHQSALEMAQVELEMGKDEATKTLAQRVIDDQSAEIIEMRSMLEAMGVEPPAAE